MSNVSTGLDEQISISLPKGTLLVLFEFLARSREGWRGSHNERPPGNSFVLSSPDAAERVALWHLEDALEKTLPEIFAPEYKDLITSWKQRLTSQ